MNKVFFAPVIFWNFLLLTGCNIGPGTRDIGFIKSRYSAAAINCFYELAFYDHADPKKIQSIRKRRDDIYFSISGDTLRGDRQMVLNAVEEIRKLHLPLKIIEAKKGDKSNLSIIFGSQKWLGLEKNISGITTNDYYFSDIVKSTLKITNDEVPLQNRQGVILHELVHSLGLLGHSYKYSDAILRTNLPSQLNHIDKETIKLLYEPAIVAGYKGKAFEKDFSDILYSIESKYKLLAFAKKANIDTGIFVILRQKGLASENQKTEDCIVKFSTPVSVYVSREVPQMFSSTIQAAIEQINTCSPNIKLNLVGIHDQKNLDGIYLKFKKTNAPECSMSIDRNWDLVFPGMCKSEITINYNKEVDERLNIANALYRSLCLPGQKGQFFIRDNKLFLSDQYKTLLKLYYNPILPSGFTRSDLDYVITRLNDLH